jgi:hypothetical protein
MDVGCELDCILLLGAVRSDGMYDYGDELRFSTALW